LRYCAVVHVGAVWIAAAVYLAKVDLDEEGGVGPRREGNVALSKEASHQFESGSQSLAILVQVLGGEQAVLEHLRNDTVRDRGKISLNPASECLWSLYAKA
jgi:hypothetical protein